MVIHFNFHTNVEYNEEAISGSYYLGKGHTFVICGTVIQKFLAINQRKKPKKSSINLTISLENIWFFIEGK